MRVGDPGTGMIRDAALMLAEINQRVVFVGGAVVGLLIDDPGAQGIRATADVDTIVEVFEPGAFSVLEQALMELKFEPVSELRCRYRKAHITLDFMPTISGVLGFQIDGIHEHMRRPYQPTWVPCQSDTSTDHTSLRLSWMR